MKKNVSEGTRYPKKPVVREAQQHRGDANVPSPTQFKAIGGKLVPVAPARKK